MNHLDKTRWADRAFLLLLALLASIWVLVPPQRIDQRELGNGPFTREAATLAKPGFTP